MKRRNLQLLIGLGCLVPLQVYLVAVWLPRFLNLSGGLANLDSRFSYNSADVNALMAVLGLKGINHYMLGAIVDLFYAASMGLTIFALLRLVHGDVIKDRILRTISLALPMAYGVLDWTENIGIFIYLARYPSPVGGFISWFSLATSLKQTMPIAASLYLLVLLGIRIRSFVRARQE